ncbi:MAG: type II toxin-antitoxin system prevent-host-death family antitoxin [Mycobacterium sp.]
MTVTASPLGEVDEDAVGIVELRANLGHYVDVAFHRDVVTTVHRNRRRVAVLISADRYDQLIAAAAAHGAELGEEEPTLS